MRFLLRPRMPFLRMGHSLDELRHPQLLDYAGDLLKPQNAGSEVPPTSVPGSFERFRPVTGTSPSFEVLLLLTPRLPDEVHQKFVCVDCLICC